MMSYVFNPATGTMQYVFEEVPFDSLVVTPAGRAWYREQVKILESQGVDYPAKLLVEHANLKFPAEVDNAAN